MHRCNNLLFLNIDWYDFENTHRQKILSEIAQYNPDTLLNTSTDNLCRYIQKKYELDVPVLRRDEIVLDHQEAMVDVSRCPDRFIIGRSGPAYVSGSEIEVEVPFDGDPDLFGVKPTKFNLSPPMAEVRGNILVFRYKVTDIDTQGLKRKINDKLREIDFYLRNLDTNAKAFNDTIASIAEQTIEQRKSKILRDRNSLADLGFQIRQRGDAPKTFVTPNVRRKIIPQQPKASSLPYKPEPTIPMEIYEHILDVLSNMALVMERSPSAFTSLNEEALRTHFLVHLNGQYEGEATGETFNYNGKTDILVRHGGKNIFIAECKFWTGPKGMTDTINQLLSYSSWRDTKTAIIMFNKNKDFSNMVQAMIEATQGHPNCKKLIKKRSDTSFQYKFSHPDDSNRELTITVMAFDVPK